MSDIRSELDALEVLNFEKKSFVPLSKLKNLFTRDKITL
jgi:hypothetical protein